MNRVGIGYDVHQLVEGRKVFLGGVELKHPDGLGLLGHSDADVLMHAIADALLGALGLGDIGHHFPNTDMRWKDVPSRVFLEEIARLAGERNAVIENIDASLMAEAPKIAPHIGAMKENLARALKLDPARINMKATTNETLGFVGRGEGIAAMAVACVTLP